MLARHHHLDLHQGAHHGPHSSKTSPQQTPERRYAVLHRALDQGKKDDTLLTELVHVCVRIGNTDEAVQTAKLIQSPTERGVVQRWLASKGLIELSTRPSRPSSASRLTSPQGSALRPAGHPAARRPAHPPSPSSCALPHPGVLSSARLRDRAWEGLEKLLRPSFKEELSGAFRFLFEDHMPLTVMVTALTFPLVIGLGGFLTQGTNEMLLPVIALVPILSVVALVCALSRKIMIEATAGSEDPPAIPELGALVLHAGRFLVDSAIMSAVFLGPAAVCHYRGAPKELTLGALVLGLLLLPMALVLRQVRNDWRAFWPPTLLGAVASGGLSYLGVLIVSALLFAPAVAVGIATLGSELYLQISFAGPLVAMPLFVASRFIGRVLSNRSAWLKSLLVDQRQKGWSPQAIGHASSAAFHAAVAASTRRRLAATPAPASRRTESRERATAATTTGGVYKAASRTTTARKGPVRRKRARLDAPTHPEMSKTRSTRAGKKSTPPTRDESCRLFFKVRLDGDDPRRGHQEARARREPSLIALKGEHHIVAGAPARTKPGTRTGGGEKEEDR